LVPLINWRLEGIGKIDRKSRSLLTMYKMYHPKTDINRLYWKRKEGARGLLQFEATYKTEIVNTVGYLNTV